MEADRTASIAARRGRAFLSRDMYCAVCEKESNNRRVCPHCFTPYPIEGASTRRPGIRDIEPRRPTTTETGIVAQGRGIVDGLRAFVMSQTPVVRWAGAAIIAALLIWTLTSSGEPEQSGVVQSNLVVTPMEREEALSTIRTTRETALVDVQQDEVFISYAAATFPVQEDGQMTLARRFARADEIVEGRKRRIFFYNPNGKLFAQSDGVQGVVAVR